MPDPTAAPNPFVHVAAIQQARSENREENLQATAEAVAAAADAGAQLVCLQELFDSRYFCQTEDHRHFGLAEPIPGETTRWLGELARRHQVVLVAGLFERRGPGLFHNSSVVLEKTGELVGHYRKMHIPDDPHYYEKFYFTPGDLGFRTVPTSAGRLGLCICWDQWFPEAARIHALQGAEILIYPTAIGWLAEDKPVYGESQRSAWQTMLRSHAIANGLFVIAPNRVGHEDDIEFWGSSLVIDPYGNIVGEGPVSEPAILHHQCDLQLLDVARTHWPFLRDRRIDAYSPLLHRWIDG